MASEVKVPTLGESITEATLGQWLKQPGEAVKADEPIASLETDKVAVDVPSPVDGVMGEQAVAEGDTVQVGAVIALVQAGSQASTAATPAPEDRTAVGQAEAAAPPEPAAAPADEEGGDPRTLSPSVRRAVLEHHLDPSKIRGTGKDGRLTKDDVLAAAKAGQQQAKAARLPSPRRHPLPLPWPAAARSACG